jgi:hypothetical protein
LWSEGILAVLVFLVVGLALRPGRERILAATAGLFVVALLLLFGGGGLSKYNGAAWICMIALAPFALDSLRQRLPPRLATRLTGVLALLLFLPAAAQTIDQGIELRASWVEPKVVEWLAEHVPTGTPVYSFPRQIRAIPPTGDSAEKMWLEVADPDAWRKKLRHRLNQTGLTMSHLPRALSIETMHQRLAIARRSFFLASPYWNDQPRYDVRIRDYVYRPGTPLEVIREEFLQTGGVLIHYGEPLTDLGDAAAAWIAANGTGMFVYIRPASGS